jgi:hypothetical protein
VSDSLEYSPERCTIIAAYNRLVIGVAIISSPRETYITYLAVRAGWDNAQIATWANILVLRCHLNLQLIFFPLQDNALPFDKPEPAPGYYAPRLR